MKVIIELLIVVFVVVAGANILITIKGIELGFLSEDFYRIPLIILPGIGIYFLNRLYHVFAEQDATRLNKQVIQQTRQALKNPDGYELWPTFTRLLVWLVIIALMGLALYFMIKQWHDTHETVLMILLSILILVGLLFLLAYLHGFILLIGRPVIRINRQGISHFMLEFIDWRDVTGLYLSTAEVKGIKHHSLEIIVRNPGFYKDIHKSLLARYLQPEQISLLLPVSEENAKIAEAVAIAYVKRRHRKIR